MEGVESLEGLDMSVEGVQCQPDDAGGVWRASMEPTTHLLVDGTDLVEANLDLLDDPLRGPHMDWAICPDEDHSCAYDPEAICRGPTGEIWSDFSGVPVLDQPPGLSALAHSTMDYYPAGAADAYAGLQWPPPMPFGWQNAYGIDCTGYMPHYMDAVDWR
eukprot:3162792-Amphidinium_carterae.1